MHTELIALKFCALADGVITESTKMQVNLLAGFSLFVLKEY